MPQYPPLECGHQIPKVPSILFSQEVFPSLSTSSLSLPSRALHPLTPPSGRGRSPLHCHPSPWPGERDSRRSALLSCPGSSLAQRWSASSRGGSAGTGNRVRASGPQSETQEPLLAPTPLFLSPKSAFLETFWKDSKATGTRNLTRGVLLVLPEIPVSEIYTKKIIKEKRSLVDNRRGRGREWKREEKGKNNLNTR